MLPSAFRSLVSTHSRTKAAAYLRQRWNKRKSVSTHSRTKAAADGIGQSRKVCAGFNTQPHEGGCIQHLIQRIGIVCFNTQPHEGGCQLIKKPLSKPCRVSTHSRAEAAAKHFRQEDTHLFCFNTQPRGGGCPV